MYINLHYLRLRTAEIASYISDFQAFSFQNRTTLFLAVFLTSRRRNINKPFFSHNIKQNAESSSKLNLNADGHLGVLDVG